MLKNVRFTLNGKLTDIEVEPSHKLMDVLRDQLNLKGTKCGCNVGECGACTVIINGLAINSCLYTMRKVEGAEVWTIEGLANGDRLHPLQTAFLEMGAIQCGFCTPGVLMSAKALLDKNPAPTSVDIESALGGNICRCTGYVKIIEAVEYAAALLRGEKASPVDFRRLEKTTQIATDIGEAEKPDNFCFGISTTDVDGIAKATGALQFTCDRYAEGMLHGAFVWSGRPCADILSLDYSAAEKIKGVQGVVTAKDVPGRNAFATFVGEQPVFCDREVKFMGDMLALVVADTELNARAAAALVKVEYVDKKGVYTISEGRADVENPQRLIRKIDRVVGDVDKARESSAQRFSGEFKMERIDHAQLETVTALATYQAGGRIQVTTCTQAPFECRANLSAVLNLPKDKIQVIAAPIGGSFGKKCDLSVESAAAVAAYVLKKPVMVRLNRDEDMVMTTKRHAFETSCEIGVDSEGRLQFIDSKLFSDAGPYVQHSGAILEQSMLFSGGPYSIPNIKLHGECYRTNNVLGGAFRGFGINQGVIGIESLLDEAAEKLNITPFEIRRRNAMGPGSVTVGGEILRHSVGIRDTIDECEKIVNREYERYAKIYPQGDKVLGLGIACGFKNVGAGRGNKDDGGCVLGLRSDGRVEMRISGADMGQGFRTAMTQIAAEKLKRKPEDFVVINGDTDLTLEHFEGVAERQTYCTGRAVAYCADLLLKKMTEENWEPGRECAVEYYHRVDPTYSMDDNEARTNHPETYRNYPAYAYLTQAVFIELDKSTGQIKVLKAISCNDCGRAINPQQIEGQIQGSCSQAIGYALSEGYPMENGLPLVKSYGQLGMPTIDETPEYEIVIIENPDPGGPLGAKGISEVATVPMTPAVINAIHDASGVRLRHVPIKPGDILDAMHRVR